MSFFSFKKPHPPVIFIILGATGNLANKKLFLAFWNLYEKNLLPEKFKIIGYARRPFTDDSFRAFLKENALKESVGAGERKDLFLSHFSYHQGVFEDVKAYYSLAEKLGEIDRKWGQCSDKVFHLATSPAFYEKVLTAMDASGLTLSCAQGGGKTRLFMEKPIGFDLRSAQDILNLTERLFKKDQIFYIDHYSFKAALRYFLTMRFSEPSLFSIWNGEDIKRINIRLLESKDIMGRGDFYGKTGALRDVGQNHILHMLALAVMGGASDPTEERNNREEVLKNVKLDDRYFPLRAQYIGIENEEGLREKDIESYFRIPARLGLLEWQNTLFLLESGKALRESSVDVSVCFKTRKPLRIKNVSFEADMLVFTIQPDPKITAVMYDGTDLRGKIVKTFSFNELVKEENEENIEGYEKAYVEGLKDNRAYFISRGEIEASWKFIDKVLKVWKDSPLIRYPKGVYPEEIK